MPTIAENQVFTVLIEFKVAPEQQQPLIDRLATLVETHIEYYPGFISASFHASEDGQRVINYAQWRSREAWSEGPLGDAEVGAAIQEATQKAVAPCRAERISFNTFRVVRTVEAL